MSESVSTAVRALPSPDTFLVKFNFTNSKWIPVEILEKQRDSNVAVDQGHADSARDSGSPELGEMGRVRRGRRDTGKHVAELDFVQAAMLRRGFVNAGWWLAAAHWHRQEPRQGSPSGKPKYVVTLMFSRTESDALELKRTTLEALRELARTTWQHCHVWLNSNGVSTINLVGRQPDARPRLALAVRGGELKAIPVEGHLPEEDE